MKTDDIEKGMEVVEGIVKDSLACTNPTTIANNLIKLSAWKFRFGELVAESAKFCQERENGSEYSFATKFLEARKEVRDFGDKTKPFSEEDARSSATIGSREEKDLYSQTVWYKTRVWNFWRDLETIIDAIKYKQRAIENEYKNLQFGHSTEV